MTFDPTKPVRTRYGRPARIICTDRRGLEPILALVLEADGIEYIHSFKADGIYGDRETPLDLVNATPKIEGWVNVYRDEGHGYMGSTIHVAGSPTSKAKAAADAERAIPMGIKRIACIFVSFEEGDGLS